MFMIKSKISHHVNQDYEANMNALEGLQSRFKTCPLLLTLNGHSLGVLVTLVLVIFFFSFFC